MTTNTAPAAPHALAHFLGEADARDYPHWNPEHAATMVSTDEVFVDVTVEPTPSGNFIEITRTVWNKAYRSRDRHVLWTGIVAVIPREAAAAFAQDFVGSLAVR